MSIAKLNDFINNEKFFHHYQALYDLQSLTTIGYEATLQTNVFKNEDILLEKLTNSSRFFELEMRSIRKALYAYDKLAINKKIFLHVYPMNVIHVGMIDHLEHFVKKTNLTPNQVVLEINQVDIAAYSTTIMDTLFTLQSLGYQISLSDVGKHADALQTLLEFNPDYIKMDRFFAKDLAKSVEKQEMVRSIVTYCLHTNTSFILKGVEVPEDLNMAKNIGITILQGDLLAKPEPISVIENFEATQSDNLASNE